VAQEFLLKNESYFLLAEAVGGVYNADQLKVIASISESESAFIKVTEDHAVGLMVARDMLPAVQESLRQAGLIPRLFRGPGKPMPRACLGELCPHCEQDALGDSITLSNELAEAFPNGAPPLRIALNGCHQNCLASGTDDIHLVGEAEGYKLSIGGKGAELPQLGQFLDDNIEPAALGGALATIIQTFLDNRADQESLHDFIERCGTSVFSQSEAPEAPEAGPDATESADAIDAGLDPDSSADLLGDADLALAEEDNGPEDLTLDEVDTLLDTSLDDTSLEDASLDDTSLDDTSLEDASLDDASLDDTSLDDTSLDDASLDDTSLDDASLDDTSLDDASLDDTSLDDTSLDDASLDDALLDRTAFVTGEQDDPQSAESITMDPSLSTDEAPLQTELEPDLTVLSASNSGTDKDDPPEDAASLMADEYELEESQATDDDVARVTQAMRSEAALEHSGDTHPSALQDLDSAAAESEVPELPEAHDDSSRDADEDNNPADLPDLPRSFLVLQDQAADAGALQVKLVEDTVCIVTPDNARLNIPIASLRSGLRVVINVGGFSFSSVIRDGQLAVRFGSAALSIPLSSISDATEEQSAA
jgi:uncharacterized protein YjbI with pentapeptide repeats